MFLGIDLGTSNSAIVGISEKEPRLFKTIEGTDVLPSALMLDKRGNMLIGGRAYEQAAYSPEAVAQGFKRLMGTSTELSFSGSDRKMSAEEASAEIIKALITQAKVAAGEIEIGGAVITIPAAFNQMQSEATMRAGRLAGLEKIALLQEPVAAALSSIAQSRAKSGQFLVYDLGGGTFDVAIVQSIAGNANVISHAGINMLGGRDFDRSLLNSVVRPWLLSNFDIPDDFQKEKKYQRLLRIAQFRCERSKIALSTQASDRIFADENQIGTLDESGTPIYIDAEATREALEVLVEEDVSRSIELCRSLLEESGYQAGDIDRVVLIGGPTRMPIVRRRIGEELGIRIDLDTDPMTAVATGAAIFAEDRDWNRAAGGAKRTRATKAAASAPQLSYEYPSRTADEKIRVRIRVASGGAASGYRVVADTGEGWTSGQVSVSDGAEIRDVPVAPGNNRIRMTLLDAAGNPVSSAADELIVQRAGARADGMPITHTIAVKVVTGGVGAERNELAPIIKKGTALPASGSERFRSSRDLRANDSGFLEFELFEQADSVADPELNLAIGAFRIDSSDLERGDVIRKGDDVFIHWSIDANGLLTCTYELPSISRSFSSPKSYVSIRDHKKFDGPDGVRVARESIDLASHELDSLDKALGKRVAGEVSQLQDRIVKQREILELSHEADTRRVVTEESRSIRQEIARIRSRPENVQSVLRAEIDGYSESVSGLVQDIDSKTTIQVNRLAGLARDALAKGDAHGVEDARRSLDEMRAIVLADLTKRPPFWVGMFEDLANSRHLAIDKEKHDRFAREGEEAIKREDFDGLRATVFNLRDNLAQVPAASRIDVLAGLMR